MRSLCVVGGLLLAGSCMRSGRRCWSLPIHSWWGLLVFVVMAIGGFSISSAFAQSSLTSAAATPPQEAAAEVILRAPGVGLCPELIADFRNGNILAGSARQDLLTRCREVVRESGLPGGNLTDVQSGLQAMAPEEIATQSTYLVEASNIQFSNISARLAALRAGARGVSLGQFAMLTDQGSIPLNLVASTAPMAVPVEKAVAPAPTAWDRFGIFATGSFSGGDRDATDRESGFDFGTFGLTAGADYRATANFIAGLALDLKWTDIDLDDDGGSLDAFGLSGSFYSTYYVSEQFFLDGIVSVGWNDFDIDRSIRYAIRELNPDGTPTGGIVNVDQVASADTDGWWFGFSIGGGYDVGLGAVTLTPLARLNYQWATVDGYEEHIDDTGPGSGLALKVNDQDIESLTSVLGVQATYALSVPWGVLQPQLRVEWEHEYMNDSETIKANFVEDPTPDGDSQIQLETSGPDRDFFNLAVGLVAAFRGGLSAFAQYETVLGLDDISFHQVAFGVRAEL